MQAGQSGISQICNINKTVNCDSALLSPYSSFFNIPISNFGLAFNILLALILIGLLLEFLGRTSYWKNAAFYLSGFIAVASAIMLIISFLTKTFCPVCFALYGLSFFSVGFLLFIFRQDLKKIFVLEALKDKSSLFSGGIVLLIVTFLHMTFVNQLDLKSIKEQNKLSYFDWLQAQVENFEHEGILSRGPRQASVRIREFADFLCPYCKKAQKSLKTFLKFHPSVQLQFYPYPLDETCRSPKINSSEGLSCKLSKMLICSQKQNKGWEVHDLIFEQQEKLVSKSITEIFKMINDKVSINLKNLKSCTQSKETAEELAQQISVGTQVEIPGTPSFFVNEKKLQPQNIQTILEKIYKKINSY